MWNPDDYASDLVDARGDDISDWSGPDEDELQLMSMEQEMDDRLDAEEALRQQEYDPSDDPEPDQYWEMCSGEEYPW